MNPSVSQRAADYLCGLSDDRARRQLTKGLETTSGPINTQIYWNERPVLNAAPEFTNASFEGLASPIPLRSADDIRKAMQEWRTNNLYRDYGRELE